jgi:hypothetical protein
VKEISVVQGQEPAGICTVVVDATTEFNAFCTSLALHEAALIVWAFAANAKKRIRTGRDNSSTMFFIVNSVLTFLSP